MPLRSPSRAPCLTPTQRNLRSIAIMIKAPKSVLLTIVCMVLANWSMVRPCYCLTENNRGVDEAARLWTAFMVAVMTLVGYMIISGDVPEGRDPPGTQDAMPHGLLPHNQNQGSVTDHDIWSDLEIIDIGLREVVDEDSNPNIEEDSSEDMYNSMSHEITQDEIFSNLSDLDEGVGENGMHGLSHPSTYVNDEADLSNNVVMFDLPPPDPSPQHSHEGARLTKVVGKAKPMGHMARDWNGNVVPGSRGGLRDYLTIIMIFLALIDAAWVGESDNDLMIQHSTFLHSANGKYPAIDKLPHINLKSDIQIMIRVDHCLPVRGAL